MIGLFLRRPPVRISNTNKLKSEKMSPPPHDMGKSILGAFLYRFDIQESMRFTFWKINASPSLRRKTVSTLLIRNPEVKTQSTDIPDTIQIEIHRKNR